MLNKIRPKVEPWGTHKANHLAYTAPRWYGNRISADCQQKLFSPKYDASGRFLLVSFIEKEKWEDDTHR